MRRGFTILELLVASLLLGMLVTILTMIFNQSSIAWRTGMAGVADLDQVRDNIAEIREEADNIFVHGQSVYRLTGLWDKDGNLRERTCNQKLLFGSQNARMGAPASDTTGENTIIYRSHFESSFQRGTIESVAVGSGNGGRNVKTYTVGVTSWGPDGKENTYDDITTWPDEIE
jgi:prepilin-type N-terminal cleavage/methylation domain-containing protein